MYRGVVLYSIESLPGSKLAFLNNVVGVFESEIDKVLEKVWEWK